MRDFFFMTTRSLTLAAVFFATGCAASNERECTSGSECASGACSSDGACVPSATPKDTGGVTSDAEADSGAMSDAPSSDTPSDTPSTGCMPNKDGTINADEVPIRAGLKATFRVAENASFATAGTALSDGRRKWDLSMALAGDRDALVTTRELAGTWYGGKFPGASHSTELSLTSDLLGVFQTTAAALLLVGVVSPTESSTKTELKYATPPQAIQFPLQLNKTWKVTSNVSGTASGIATFYTETWDSKVDARGELVTPFGTFDVLRVRTILTRQVGVVTTITRSFAFVTECYGTIATITSRANETQEEFTTAAELRRIAP
jgi:hypothetical protein